MELLQIEEGDLYVQSSAYVYDLLLKELHLYPELDEDKPSAMVADDGEVELETEL